jgi:hypothetical protein
MKTKNKIITIIILKIIVSNVQADMLVANWQYATYFYQNQAYRYSIYELQSQSIYPAGNYSFSCIIQTPNNKNCHITLLGVPNQPNAIQSCLEKPNFDPSTPCLLFSPCQYNRYCNTTYYQSNNCQSIQFNNQYKQPWVRVGRIYWLGEDTLRLVNCVFTYNPNPG